MTDSVTFAETFIKIYKFWTDEHNLKRVKEFVENKNAQSGTLNENQVCEVGQGKL